MKDQLIEKLHALRIEALESCVKHSMAVLVDGRDVNRKPAIKAYDRLLTITQALAVLNEEAMS